MPVEALPYPLPERGEPARVAFVGQRTYFEAAALHEPAGGLIPAFVDFRPGGDPDALLEELDRLRPHAIVAFRPEALPAGALASVRAPVLGFVTEPLPRPDRPPHPHYDFNLDRLREGDRNNVDRVALTDPFGWEAAAELLPAWRVMPLPVDDRLYRTPTPTRRPPRVTFIGYSTMHREQALVDLKHRFDVRHYAHGLIGEELRRVMHDTDVALHIHAEEWILAFDSNVLRHMAAGHLVISQTLEPSFGLQPDIDYLEVSDRWEMDLRVHQVFKMPDMYDRIRIRGHHASRQHAASKVWPRVIRDLFDDLRAFGTERQLAG